MRLRYVKYDQYVKDQIEMMVRAAVRKQNKAIKALERATENLNEANAEVKELIEALEAL